MVCSDDYLFLSNLEVKCFRTNCNLLLKYFQNLEFRRKVEDEVKLWKIISETRIVSIARPSSPFQGDFEYTLPICRSEAVSEQQPQQIIHHLPPSSVPIVQEAKPVVINDDDGYIEKVISSSEPSVYYTSLLMGLGLHGSHWTHMAELPDKCEHAQSVCAVSEVFLQLLNCYK